MIGWCFVESKLVHHGHDFYHISSVSISCNSQKLQKKNNTRHVNLFIWDSCKLTNQYELYFNWYKYWHKTRLIQQKIHHLLLGMPCALFLSILIRAFFVISSREKWCEKKTSSISGTIVSKILFTIYSNGIIEMTYDCVCLSHCSLHSNNNNNTSYNGTKTSHRSQLMESKVIERMTDRWIDRMLNLL